MKGLFVVRGAILVFFVSQFSMAAEIAANDSVQVRSSLRDRISNTSQKCALALSRFLGRPVWEPKPMMRGLNSQVLEALESTVDVLRFSQERKVAILKLEGTFVDRNWGDQFFHDQLNRGFIADEIEIPANRGSVPLVLDRNLILRAYNSAMAREDIEGSLGWMARAWTGRSEVRIQEQARKYFYNTRSQRALTMRAVAEYLQENGFEVWMVSALPAPVASVVADYAGVAQSRLVTTEFEVDESGLFTGRLIRRRGSARPDLEDVRFRISSSPTIVMGGHSSDAPLMSLSTGFSVFMQSSSVDAREAYQVSHELSRAALYPIAWYAQTLE